jgi:hypothetical protein
MFLSRYKHAMFCKRLVWLLTTRLTVTCSSSYQVVLLLNVCTERWLDVSCKGGFTHTLIALEESLKANSVSSPFITNDHPTWRMKEVGSCQVCFTLDESSLMNHGLWKCKSTVLLLAAPLSTTAASGVCCLVSVSLVLFENNPLWSSNQNRPRRPRGVVEL